MRGSAEPRPASLIKQARAAARAAGVPLYSVAGLALARRLIEARSFAPARDREAARC